MSDQFEKEAQNQLRKSEQLIDAATQSKLHQARMLALKQLDAKTYWWKNSIILPVSSLAVASVIVLVLVIDVISPRTLLSDSALIVFEGKTKNIDSLSVNDTQNIVDEMDLYEEMEFYQWLAESEYAS